MIQRKKLYVYSGFIWCVLFGLMSFYWALGGMVGVKSLGGSIYQHALKREASFIVIVWLTGFMKLGGGLFLLLLLKDWSIKVHRILYYIALIGGVFLFLYGLANFVSLSLAFTGLLSMQIEGYALKWRLFFWEPFWMLGGVLFILSSIKFNKEKNTSADYRQN
ncbi:DUF3995 domain-containing protein [Bacillus sp. FJAT-49732]|uniref:DUF3995 domain-containing protein n=1 Tax=Lederbergia citrisecunda TaxID=2833583 RepID=A0A942TTX4_9BACI|nr:DUF3995 domain-containing protein [Lederbergia citrisecunda]MBS4202192.1 DUF3995 domain-containing protein [Lederbergia citrisecunda]